MQIKIKQLKHGMDIVEHARESRATIPVLSMVKATVSAGSVKLQANNMDMNFAATIPVATDDKADQDNFLIDDPRSMLNAIVAAGGDLVRLEPREEGDRTRLGFSAGQLEMSQSIGVSVLDFVENSSRVANAGFEFDRNESPPPSSKPKGT